MTTISFTTYIHATAEEVESRISTADVTPPKGAMVDVVPFIDRSQVVISVPWRSDTEAIRAESTLAATRYVRSLDRVASAA